MIPSLVHGLGIYTIQAGKSCHHQASPRVGDLEAYYTLTTLILSQSLFVIVIVLLENYRF